MRDITINSPFTSDEISEIQNQSFKKKEKENAFNKKVAYFFCFVGVFFVLMVLTAGLLRYFEYSNMFFERVCANWQLILIGSGLCFVMYSDAKEMVCSPSEKIFCDDKEKDRLACLALRYKCTEVALFIKEVNNQSRNLTCDECYFLDEYFKINIHSQANKQIYHQLDLLCDSKQDVK